FFDADHPATGVPFPRRSTDTFPLGLRTLFERAFARRIGPRPTAVEWVAELTLLEKGLGSCLSNAAHIIPSLSAPCPWCRIEKELGRPLFPASPSHPQTTQPVRTDLQHEVVRVVRFAREYAGENVQPMWRRSDVKPSKDATKQLRENATSSTAPATATRLHFLLNGHASAQPFVDRHAATRTTAVRELDRWRTDLGIWEINARAEKLRQRLRTLDRLKANRPVLLAQAKDRVIAAAAVRTMHNLPLDTASVPGIGAGLRAHLVRYGIATAADVTRESLATVPGLGDARIAALLLWHDRIMVEAQRSVARDISSLEGGIALETASLDRHIAHVEDGLRADCADLEHRVSKVRKRVWLVDRTVEEALRAQDQAVMDLELLGIDPNAHAALARASTLPSPPALAPAKPKKTKKKSGKIKRQPMTCPACGAPMVKRWANTAQAINKLFFGCSTYPRCTGSRPVTRKRAKP
ncbi:topoisomerase DNA-binding C4 zinc finger domain-containing protein, partial [Sphingomonas olei]|uniref:topoisomerase DNA-binding C4 zinc finger domain-containing protein n=1 Tax=Sphingomonas olei TaxID=1886787 RepID=UPI001B3B30F4